MSQTEPAGPLRAFVIGHPIAHSKSPRLHGHWIAALGIDARYDAIDVAPDDLAHFIQRVREGAFCGGNVTIPHKETVADLVDRLDATAQKVGAVNTLYVEDGALIGSNTDVYGFVENIRQSVHHVTDHTARRRDVAIILGAGGAAKAVAVGLSALGFAEVLIANRTLPRAQALCDQMARHDPATSFTAIPWEALDPHLVRAACVVNATSLGMTGQPPLEIDLSPLPPGAIVNDLVYAPLETELLAQARRLGHQVVDGLGMLLHQAAPGFARWFGVNPVVDDTLREAVLKP